MSENEKKRCLNILKLPESAGYRDVHTAFRRLAIKYHPDVNRAKNAPRVFREIVEAYNFLLDSLRKQEEQSGERIFQNVKKDPILRQMSFEEIANRLRFSSSSHVRRSAAMAIGMAGGTAAKRALFEALEDKDPEVQAAVMMSLGPLCRLGDLGRLFVSLRHVKRRDTFKLIIKSAFGITGRGVCRVIRTCFMELPLFHGRVDTAGGAL